MTRKRRNHSPEFKAKVALDAAKRDKTISRLRRQSNSPLLKRKITSDGRQHPAKAGFFNTKILSLLQRQSAVLGLISHVHFFSVMDRLLE
ncbi:transposase [Vibrio cholerae]|uniref:transposase n=1 Tax=Vibrio cholerae TaxID=666 RepID=UPI000E0B525C|nr:transposase [Vibrio cholerae]